MDELVTTEEFPKLQRHYDITGGVYDEYSNRQDARTHFAQVMQERGYKLGKNHTWLKSGLAAVVGPR